MPDFSVVRKKKAKKMVRIFAAIAAIIIIILCIIALLGRSSGAFTVSLRQGTRSIGLTTSATSEEYQTYMTTGSVPEYDEFTYDSMCNSEYFGSEENLKQQIDDERTNNQYLDSKTPNGTIKFFKFTFYVANCGSVGCDYTLTLTMHNTTKQNDGLDAILRVGFFENKVVEGTDEHKCRFYAKTAHEPFERVDEEGKRIKDYREPLSSRYCDDDHLCEEFISATKILQSEIKDFMPEDRIRYTFLFWLEGTDWECQGDAPLDNFLKLGVSINVNE